MKNLSVRSMTPEQLSATCFPTFLICAIRAIRAVKLNSYRLGRPVSCHGHGDKLNVR